MLIVVRWLWKAVRPVRQEPRSHGRKSVAGLAVLSTLNGDTGVAATISRILRGLASGVIRGPQSVVHRLSITAVITPKIDRQMVVLNRSEWLSNIGNEADLLRALPAGSLAVEQVR